MNDAITAALAALKELDRAMLPIDTSDLPAEVPEAIIATRSAIAAIHATMAIPTLEQTIERIKREIVADILNPPDGFKVIPHTVASFEELHNYRDANCYGGFCDDDFADVLIAHFGGRDEHEGMPDAMLDYMNAAHAAIDAWMRSGELATLLKA